jgi:cupin 2 domain-containing protein
LRTQKKSHEESLEYKCKNLLSAAAVIRPPNTVKGQQVMPNIFDDLPTSAPDEVLTELLAHPRARIERIVSTGQATPEDAAYDQKHDEWVLLLRGAAALWVEGETERTLGPGDHVFIPARRRHRVTWTSCEEPTVWLAVHLSE